MSVLEPYRGQLAKGLAALGLDLPAGTQERLIAFGELLLKWNRVYNLTALRAPEEVVTHHLLDSLAVLPHLAGVERLADIGSGAGLPGIALAVVRPELEVVSVETVNKKAAFQQQAKIELGLANFRVENQRVEKLAADRPFDGVISRAFAELALFVELAGHLVAPGGRIFAMKGVYPAEEIARLPAGWQVAAIHRLAVPGLDAERHLIILQRDRKED
ncbi:16S rRNA (guanine(527)-N(7))-methyltransferase RsmG [Pseudothauera rhizosphaerae]|uniref:Ribosomal RNA small subunit methyltransferase G n=1 Tax=Pseudothauera rhizosphaerae TaxID=2565932 RepID=A0A4S4AM05_9RHOO|nr:16S rRNA (guanine(527)-N(7))-methyltransferase RsmG [Pseudothauera rhizosphaerae]THF60177.1 16S rRNA (guanine(527)-N(7))-methyltransferase RsmG [Pseudothauera rhizosphaerae]